MPTEEKSHVQTSAGRLRVTDTRGPYTVGEVRVLRVGSIVALHLGTPSGRFVFHIVERSFVKHARATCDDQGNPFRSLSVIDETPVDEPPTRAPSARECRPLTVVAVEQQSDNRGHARDARRLSVEREALYLAAWVELKTTPGARAREIANKHCLPQQAWTMWCYHNRGACEVAIAEQRRPILKPGGQLL